MSGAGPRHAERGGDRVRNLIRRRPLEVEEITFGDRPVRVPTRVEITRIKAWLCLLRNATRDPQVTRVGAVLCCASTPSTSSPSGSPLLDAAILARTTRAVLYSAGAY